MVLKPLEMSFKIVKMHDIKFRIPFSIHKNVKTNIHNYPKTSFKNCKFG